MSILTRGVVDCIAKKELESWISEDKKLTVKFGIDPTGSDLHIGHMVPLRKLAEFQKKGHNVVLLIGTFTAKIGDPTGKDKARKELSDDTIKQNIEHYLIQASKVLDIDNAKIVYNGDWFSKMDFNDILKLSAQFTVQQMLERDMFQKRIADSKPISVHEFMYPLMQGYDSVELDSDVEIGGTDQLFNMLAGRTLQENAGQRKQAVITVPILEGTDGVEKMSKSLGNYIGVMDSPKDIFGKTMSITDALICKYFRLATDVSEEDIAQMQSEMDGGANPRDYKIRLAKELVTMYHDAASADKEEQEFISVFANKNKPTDIETTEFSENSMGLLSLIVHLGFAGSNGEARRLVQGGGVKLDDVKLSDPKIEITFTSDPQLLQVGKRKFMYVKIQN
ncbi:MAG: tyrosine--tRNA ligase [Patescibacteria group bacterium]|nr:tyrosine--tRNA ligase [Patescibacteria group bacterium]